MTAISSLWVGGPLRLIHNISLSSFLYYNHDVTLYVYDLDLEVPNGVTKKDARQIVPEEEIFYHKNKLATFSDYFRYKMIYATGEMWVDADTVCFTDNFFEDKDIVFILEQENPTIFAPGVLKLPKNSEILNDLVNESSKAKNFISEDSRWAIIGPWLLTEMVHKYGLENYAIHSELVSLYPFTHEAIKFWDPAFTEEVIEKSKKAYSATFFNSGLDTIGFEKKHDIVPGSSIEYFYKKFVLQKFD